MLSRQCSRFGLRFKDKLINCEYEILENSGTQYRFEYLQGEGQLTLARKVTHYTDQGVPFNSISQTEFRGIGEGLSFTFLSKNPQKFIFGDTSSDIIGLKIDPVTNFIRIKFKPRSEEDKALDNKLLGIGFLIHDTASGKFNFTEKTRSDMDNIRSINESGELSFAFILSPTPCSTIQIPLNENDFIGDKKVNENPLAPTLINPVVEDACAPLTPSNSYFYSALKWVFDTVFTKLSTTASSIRDVNKAIYINIMELKDKLYKAFKEYAGYDRACYRL